MAKPKKISRLGYKTKIYTIDKNNLDNFEVNEDTRRKIRPGRVKKFFDLLEHGEHFDVGLMTNKVNGKYRLIDGNHRFEGIKLYIDKYPDQKVQVQVNYYEGLSDKEEKEMYTKWNIGSKQSTTDFIQQHRHEINIFKQIVSNGFPGRVTVYPSPKSISFYLLVGAYWTVTHGKEFSGGFSGTATNFLSMAQGLKKADVDKMAAFVRDFQAIFGRLESRSMYAKSTPFTAIFKIWYDNLNKITFNEMRQRFHSKLVMSPDVVNYSKQGGRGSTQQARKDFLKNLNEGRTTKLFV